VADEVGDFIALAPASFVQIQAHQSITKIPIYYVALSTRMGKSALEDKLAPVQNTNAL
jgi:hypothetical protein